MGGTIGGGARFGKFSRRAPRAYSPRTVSHSAGRARRLLDEFSKRLEPHELVLESGETRVQAARIRHDEDARLRDGLGLFARTAAFRQAKVRLVEAHAHERDDARL